MTPRERVRQALAHQETDRPPIDMGATAVTGIAASTLTRLRQALGLAGVVRVHEPFQILGDVDHDVREKMGIDTIGLWSPYTMFGYRNQGWKPWKLPDGTDVLISQNFQYTVDSNGDTLVYPQGNRSATPSGRLPKGGYYFDAIPRQGPIDDEKLDPREWVEQQCKRFSDEDLAYFQKSADDLYRNTPYSIVGNFGQGGLGDIALVPGEMLLDPKGVRDPELWYEYMATHPEYARGIFALQTEVALENLKLYHQAVGDKIDVIFMSGTDFGTQRGLFLSPDMFRDLWKPFYTRLNAWVHQNTNWKIFYHSCGGIMQILDDFVEMGVDILNPVQCSAVGMDAQTLKDKYGKKLTFWGGAIDTQKVLQFGTVEEVRQQAQERLRIFAPGGGFVFNTIHNIQQGVPVENLLAFFDVARNAASSV